MSKRLSYSTSLTLHLRQRRLHNWKASFVKFEVTLESTERPFTQKSKSSLQTAFGLNVKYCANPVQQTVDVLLVWSKS